MGSPSEYGKIYSKFVLTPQFFKFLNVKNNTQVVQRVNIKMTINIAMYTLKRLANRFRLVTRDAQFLTANIVTTPKKKDGKETHQVRS